MLPALITLLLAAAPASPSIGYRVTASGTPDPRAAVGEALGKLGPAVDLTAQLDVVLHGKEAPGGGPDPQPPMGLAEALRPLWVAGVAACKANNPSRPEGMDPGAIVCGNYLRASVAEELLRRARVTRFVDLQLQPGPHQTGTFIVEASSWAPGGTELFRESRRVEAAKLPAEAGALAVTVAAAAKGEQRSPPRAPGNLGAPGAGPFRSMARELPYECEARRVPSALEVTPAGPLAKAIAATWAASVAEHPKQGPPRKCTVTSLAGVSYGAQIGDLNLTLVCGSARHSASGSEGIPDLGTSLAIWELVDHVLVHYCESQP